MICVVGERAASVTAREDEENLCLPRGPSMRVILLLGFLAINEQLYQHHLDRSRACPDLHGSQDGLHSDL